MIPFLEWTGSSKLAHAVRSPNCGCHLDVGEGIGNEMGSGEALGALGGFRTGLRSDYLGAFTM